MSKLATAFSAGRSRENAVFPAINAWTNDDEEIITVEVPGVSPSDIDISVTGDVLTVSAERNSEPVSEEKGKEVRYHRRERAAGKFSRSIQLSFPVNSEQVSASMENGILTIRLPRAEADRPRKISVKAS